MKNIFFLVMVVGLFIMVYATGAAASMYTGVREAAMGGCGASLSTGLAAVAYNPAGLMESGNCAMDLSLGGSAKNFDQILGALNSMSDPTQFLIDNYDKQLDANGSFFGQLGFEYNKVGISLLIPNLQSQLSKPANSAEGSVDAATRFDLVLTGGRTFTLPVLPAKIDLGASVKYIGYGYGRVNVAGALPTTADNTWGTGGGFGFDLGARTKILAPFVIALEVGLAARDIASSVTVNAPATRTDTFNADGSVTKGTEVIGSAVTYNYPMSVVLGCSGTVPAIGLGFAADWESLSGGSGSLARTDSIIHLGLEYSMLMKTLVLRAGTASGTDSKTTLGVAFKVPVATLQVAAVLDNSDSRDNSYVAGGGFNF
jgi:hypothetical protein